METAPYLVAFTLVKLLQLPPLTVVARFGRFMGGLAYHLDRRHRRVALANLTLCFGGVKSEREIRDLALENFRRLGESYCCAVKTAAMSIEELAPHCEFVGKEKLLQHCTPDHTPNVIFAIGHFGNFELYARFGQFVSRFRCASTYRALRQPSLNRLLQNLRQRSGCHFFERRTDADALKAAMANGGVLLGLFVDQHSGKGGVRLPFLGHECSSNTAPAVLALRYRCHLHPGICHRVGLARWRIESGDEIPLHENGHARSSTDITRDVNKAFEEAILVDPANWFWVHNRWKPK